MNSEIKVPELGESVTEAVILKWYKKAGEAVSVDELLLELETEKVTIEVNAQIAGILEEITEEEGSSVAVGQLVGKIKTGGVAAEEINKQDQPEKSKEAKQAEERQENKQEKGKIVENNMPPSVRKLLAENDLDPKEITATGRDGRLNKGDILTLLEAKKADKVAPGREAAVPDHNESEKPVERVKMSRLRQTIAKRLKDSQNNAAILSTFNEIDMSNVINLRKNYKESFQKQHGVKLGFMSFFAKAVCRALALVPSVNAEIDGDEIIYKKYYDIGVAVGTEQGLVVPVVKNVDTKSFADIEQEIVKLATRAREGKLAMSDLTGGTFTITNGGVYGSLLSTPIINPPQTGIIGLHATQERPVAVNGQVEIRPMMYIALSYDHRIIDGKDAVTFLIKVKEAIEQPERLLFEL